MIDRSRYPFDAEVDVALVDAFAGAGVPGPVVPGALDAAVADGGMREVLAGMGQ